MAKALFISITKLIKDTALNGSIDQDIAHPYIQVAQDREIWPYLGTDLYNKLKADVIADSLTGNYQTLMNDYIQPALVQFAFCEVLPFLRVRIVNNSVVIMSSEQSSPASEGEMKRLLDRSRAIGEFYRERMIDYLCFNQTSFPEYSTNTNDDLTPRRRGNYTGGMNLTEVYGKKAEEILRDAGINI